MTEPRRVSRTRRFVLRPLIGLAVFVTILVSAAIVGIPLADRFVPEYQDVLLERLGETLDADIDIDGLSVALSRQGPMVYLNDVAITHNGEDTPAVTAQRVGLAFSLLDLVRGQYVPDGIRLDTPQATLVAEGTGVHLAHWPSTGPSEFDVGRLADLRDRLGELTVVNGDISVVSSRLPSGRARWQNIDMELSEDAPGVLKAHLSADGPAWWSRLSARARLTGRLDPSAIARWHVEADGLRLPSLIQAAANHPAPETTGETRLVLDGRWADHELVDTSLVVDQQAIRYANAEPGIEDDAPIVPAFDRRFLITGDSATNEWHLRPADATGDDDPRLVIDRADDQTALALRIDHLDAARAARLARWWQPALAGTRIDGDLEAISVRIGPDAPLDVSARFAGLVVGNTDYRIGPLSGRFEQAGDRRSLAFTGANGRIVSERYLDEPLALSDLGGRLRWDNDGPATTVSIEDFRLASREARLAVAGTLRLPGNENAPIADLAIDLTAPDIPRLLDRLPQDPALPNPKLRDWLAKAITAGRLERGHITVDGPLDKFPFPAAGADKGLHAKLVGRGLDIKYKPDWPALKNTDATLSLDGDTLDMNIAAATINGVALDRAVAHIDNVREPVLKIDGQVTDTLAPKLLSFLAASPLSKKFGPLLDAIEVAGPADLALELSLPLKPELGDIAVDGRVRPQGATLKQRYLPAPIHDIRGTLRFDIGGLVADDLTGTIDGVPITADIEPAPGNRQRIVARATPSLPADRDLLAHYLPAVWLDYVSGELPLRIGFSLGGKGAISPITIRSNLTGTVIDLPPPVAKPADIRAPLDVRVDPSAHTIVANYDQRVRLTADLGAHGTPERIVVRLGERGRELTARPGAGLWIGGAAQRVDTKGWFDVIQHVLYSGHQADDKRPAPSADAGGSTFDFLGGDLLIDRLALGDRYIADAHVRADPLGDAHGWRINFEGPNSQGQATYTLGARAPARIAGNFKKVAVETETLTQDSQSSESTEYSSTLIWPDLSPHSLPAIDLMIANFSVDDTGFGELNARADVTDKGWSLDHLTLTGGALTGRVAADWQVEQDITTAAARAKLEGHGLSRLIRIFGFKSPVQAEKTRLNAELTIAPNVAGLDLLHLNGEVRLAMDDGALLNVEPGPGRLLGLFNLYVLPRRLALNFRDVVDKGMAFDKARAHFLIRNGQAYTESARITTPSTNIEVAGRVGLATRDYDERISIQPKLGSGVAIASGVLGGPAVGAAVFALQKLLQKPISEISSISYRLKGSWDDPHIVEPHAESRTDGPNERQNEKDRSPDDGADGQADDSSPADAPGAGS